MATTELEKPKTRKRSAKSLRNEIRDRLKSIDDTDFLRGMLLLVRDKEPDLPDELLKKLEAGERDIAEGRVISNEEFVKWVEQKLSEH